MRVVLVALLAMACNSKGEPPAPPADPNRPTPISETEVKRGTDACQALVERVCKCAELDKSPAKQEACALAKGYPDAMKTALEVAATENSTRGDILSSYASIRKMTKTCVEQVAALPTTGCL